MTGTAALAQANSPYETLISSIIRIESEPKFQLRDRKDQEEIYRGVLKDFDSKVSKLHTQLKALTDPVADPFQARAANVPENDFFSATASDEAAKGTFSLRVERLASADTRLSKQLGGATTALGYSGSFDIEIAQPTDADPNARVAISVAVNAADTLEDLRASINTAMQNAVDSGLIESSDAASASVIKETSDTARLSLQSGQTGFGGRLTFADPDGILADLELNSAGVYSGTGGGMVTDVGTDQTTSGLSAQVNLNGLTLYRDANTITDAVEGVTLTLRKADATATTSFSVGPDTGGVQEKISAFLSEYNAVLEYIKNKTFVDGEAGTREALAGDRSATSLRFGLRDDAARTVDGLPASAPDSLRALGIEVEDDGSLTLADESKLAAALNDNADAVRELFAGSTGVATRMLERVERYVGTGGMLKDRISTADARIERLEDRLVVFDERLARREEQLRQQFAQFQETIAQLQSQQSNVFSFFG